LVPGDVGLGVGEGEATFDDVDIRVDTAMLARRSCYTFGGMRGCAFPPPRLAVQ